MQTEGDELRHTVIFGKIQGMKLIAGETGEGQNQISNQRSKLI